MNNVLIQILIILSGSLVNFLIPLLFGLEQYGLFLKTNILVFFFHKLADLISEPLISIVDKKILFIASLTIGLVVFILFISVRSILAVAGGEWLLISMLWSNCVLLAMTAQNMKKSIIFYLSFFIIIFLILLFSTYFNLLSIAITKVLIFANIAPASICFSLLLFNNKIGSSLKGLSYNTIKILGFLPGLFSLTLVNNLFTNILPVYLSFIFPPQLLGLFKTQVSIAQAATMLFPVNTKMLLCYFTETTSSSLLLEKMLKLSMNYFCIIALIGFSVMAIYEQKLEFAQILTILPIAHASIIVERYLLAKILRKQLMIINLIASFIICLAVLYLDTSNQMTLLYVCSISFYLLLMLFVTETFSFKQMIQFVAIETPIVLLCAMHSYYTGFFALLGSLLIVYISTPFNHVSIYFWRDTL